MHPTDPAAVAGRVLGIHLRQAERHGGRVSSGLIGNYERMPALQLANLHTVALVTDKDLRRRLERVFNKRQAAARRWSISRMAARSINVSED